MERHCRRSTFRQFSLYSLAARLAFALGYMTHVGTDTVAHSFVNAQCGGPFRNATT